MVATERNLGERLFAVGRKIARAQVRGQHKINPILTANEDDVMAAWAQRGIDLVVQLLEIEEWRLRSWAAMRGHKVPSYYKFELKSTQGSKYVPLAPDKMEPHDGSPCGRCGGYVTDMGEPLCVNCGDRPQGAR